MNSERIALVPKFIFSFLLFGGPFSANANIEIGFNAGEFLEKAALSKLLGDRSSGWFLPFHFTFSKSLTESSQLTTDFIYRKDNHSTFTDYDEYLFLVGLGVQVGPQLIGSLKVGGGKAVGALSGRVEGKNGGFVSGTYVCNEAAVQSSLQKRLPFSKNWNFGLGGGLLVLFPIRCENEFALSSIGVLVHRVIPIFNWDLIYTF